MTWVMANATLIVGVSETALKASRLTGPKTAVVYNGLTYTQQAAKTVQEKKLANILQKTVAAKPINNDKTFA